jgi:hypothetical protein
MFFNGGSERELCKLVAEKAAITTTRMLTYSYDKQELAALVLKDLESKSLVPTRPITFTFHKAIGRRTESLNCSVDVRVDVAETSSVSAPA